MEDLIVGAFFYYNWERVSSMLTYNAVVNRHMRFSEVVFGKLCKLSVYLLLLCRLFLYRQETDGNVVDIVHENASGKMLHAV